MREDSNQIRVLIQCPVTGRAVPTGIRADPATWSTRPIGLNKMSCPDCKQVHAWSKKDATLDSPTLEPPKPQSER